MKQTLIDRRHILKFLGGSALGTALTPLPWKVLDDVSIWTQNWSWIPVPPKGEKLVRHTTCALCPAGCGVKVSCIGAQPVGLFGLPGHPTSRGFLCPAGLLGHHLPYDPRRVAQPSRLMAESRRALPAEQILSELGKGLARLKADPAAGRVAIIDSLPGRSTSIAYRRLASQFTGGAYIVPPDPVRRSLGVFDGIAGEAYPELGIDVKRARMIVSFGADLLEGWGTPARLLSGRQASDQGPLLTQIEPRYSNTAAMADSWLPVRPGSELMAALGLAAVLVNEKLFPADLLPSVQALNEMADFRELLAALPPSRCGDLCGISPEAVARTAREMAAHFPSLALVGGNCSGGPFDKNDHLAINFLNLMTGAAGGEGGIVPRRSLPDPDFDVEGAELASPTDLSQVPDESIAFLVIDSTVPRQAIPSALIQRKLVPGEAVVLAFASGTQYSDLSPYVLPVPLYLEAFQEIPTPSDSPVASCSFSVPLVPAPPAAVSSVQWLNRLASSARLDWPELSDDSLADARIKGIWSCKRGSVYGYSDGTAKANSDFASAGELTTVFKSGACWLDSPADAVKPQLTGSAYFRPETWGRLRRAVNQGIEVVSKQTNDGVIVMPFSTALATTIASPLAAKLTRESDLYARPGVAVISPSTAGRLALQEGQKAEIETSNGCLRVRIRLDESTAPGMVFVPVSESDASGAHPDPRNVCEISEDGVWRATPAKLRRLDV